MKKLGLLVVLAACGGSKPAPEPVSNDGTGDRVTFMPGGDYLCWGGFHEYLCTVQVVNGVRQLEKVGGSDRYRGTIEPGDDGAFRLVGAYQDGTALDLTFTPQPDGSWSAPAPSAPESDHYTIRYMGAPGAVFGSQTYGGGYDTEEEPLREPDKRD